MIQLTSNANPLSPAFLQCRGGFAWWYLDVMDADGNGAVAIWSFGLPFLPGYTRAARRGEAPAARQRPSLNLALYRRGRLWSYLLQEYPAEACAYDADAEQWTFGHSLIQTRVGGGTTTTRLLVDMPVPGGAQHIRGTLEVTGNTRRPGPHEPVSGEAGPHEWTPLVGAARGRIDLDVAGVPFAIEGAAYHDRNGGRTHFEGLGIGRWIWGRAKTPDGTSIFYHLWPQRPQDSAVHLGLTIADDGTTLQHADIAPTPSMYRRDLYGMTWWKQMGIQLGGVPWLQARVDRLAERGPFYLRAPLSVQLANGDVGDGWAEWVEPARIDLARHRPLVQMRVHRVDAPNSRWLPLFSGPRETRVRRLLGLGDGVPRVPAAARPALDTTQGPP